ncbi:MAG: inositol monophosphatase [Lysobacteraceae bacterium]|nr:MAG: inositol monophosphatase [Xanthomonadaceae bacterium]
MRDPAVNIAVSAARKAGRTILRLMNRRDSLSVAEKQRHDYVSEADRAAEAEIIYEIQRHFPDHGFLAEESGAQGNDQYQWIIDPLDGTANFLYGIPHFSISLALRAEGRMVVAVIYDPVKEELFTATRGSGAFLNDHRIRVGRCTGVNGAILATGFPFRNPDGMSDYLARFGRLFDAGCQDMRRAGSAALDLAYVAAGRVDGFWESGLKPWDIAAGSLLVREAGGTVMDYSGGTGYLDNGDIVAGNLKVATNIVRCLGKL